MYEYHGNKGSRRQQEIKKPLTLYRAGGFLFISCRRYQTDHLQIYSGGVRILNVQLGICGIVSVIPLFIAHCPYAAFLMLGAALIGTGIAILFIVSVKPVTVGIFKVCKASVNGIKRMFVKEK